MKKLLLITLLFLNCASTKTDENYRAKGFNIGESSKQTVTILKPVIANISGKGLNSTMNHDEKKEYLNVIISGGEKTFKEMVFHENLISSVERNNFLFSLDKDKSVQRIISLDRHMKGDVGYKLNDNEKQTLIDFSTASKIDLVLLPVNINLSKKVVDQGRETVEIDLALSLEYQIWDISKGIIVYESVVSDTKSYFIKKARMNSTKELENLVNLTYKRLIIKIKHGDRR